MRHLGTCLLSPRRAARVGALLGTASLVLVACGGSVARTSGGVPDAGASRAATQSETTPGSATLSRTSSATPTTGDASRPASSSTYEASGATSSEGSFSARPTATSTSSAGTTATTRSVASATTIASSASTSSVCPSSCHADPDCASCAAAGSIGCCDAVTNACFSSSASSCPGHATTTGSATSAPITPPCYEVSGTGASRTCTYEESNAFVFCGSGYASGSCPMAGLYGCCVTSTFSAGGYESQAAVCYYDARAGRAAEQACTSADAGAGGSLTTVAWQPTAP